MADNLILTNAEGSVHYDIVQSLTGDEQATARNNIGAGKATEVTRVEQKVDDLRVDALGAVNAENIRAKGVEHVLDERISSIGEWRDNVALKISTEVDRAKGVEQHLHEELNGVAQRVDVEVARAKNAEEALNKRIDDIPGGAGMPEAPADGKTYGRCNREWKEVTGGGSGDVDAERERAQSEEMRIDAKIDNEILRAKGAEGSLGNDVQNLQTQINSNKDLIAQAQQDITTEVSRATTEDARLDTRCDNLTTYITNVENALVKETETRESRDKSLTDNVNKALDKVVAEQDRAVKVEAVLTGLVNDATKKITAETTRATEAEEALNTKIDDMNALEEAPVDGRLYARKNKAWQEIDGGGGDTNPVGILYYDATPDGTNHSEILTNEHEPENVDIIQRDAIVGLNVTINGLNRNLQVADFSIDKKYKDGVLAELTINIACSYTISKVVIGHITYQITEGKYTFNTGYFDIKDIDPVLPANVLTTDEQTLESNQIEQVRTNLNLYGERHTKEGVTIYPVDSDYLPLYKGATPLMPGVRGAVPPSTTSEYAFVLRGDGRWGHDDSAVLTIQQGLSVEQIQQARINLDLYGTENTYSHWSWFTTDPVIYTDAEGHNYYVCLSNNSGAPVADLDLDRIYNEGYLDGTRIKTLPAVDVTYEKGMYLAMRIAGQVWVVCTVPGNYEIFSRTFEIETPRILTPEVSGFDLYYKDGEVIRKIPEIYLPATGWDITEDTTEQAVINLSEVKNSTMFRFPTLQTAGVQIKGFSMFPVRLYFAQLPPYCDVQVPDGYVKMWDTLQGGAYLFDICGYIVTATRAQNVI